MPRYKLIIQLDPAEGMEAEFVDYYPNVHVRDVAERMPGVLRAQLFKRAGTVSDTGAHQWDYLVEYEIETDDLDAFTTQIRALSADGTIRARGELLTTPRRSVYYEPISVVFRKDGQSP